MEDGGSSWVEQLQRGVHGGPLCSKGQEVMGRKTVTVSREDLMVGQEVEREEISGERKGNFYQHLKESSLRIQEAVL